MRKSKKTSRMPAKEAEQHEGQDGGEKEQENEKAKRAGEGLALPAKKRTTATQRLVAEAASMFQNKAPGFERRSSRNEKNGEGAAGGAADTPADKPADKFKMNTDESFHTGPRVDVAPVWESVGTYEMMVDGWVWFECHHTRCNMWRANASHGDIRRTRLHVVCAHRRAALLCSS